MDIKSQEHVQRNHFAIYNQMTVIETGKQFAVVQMPVTENHLNPGGVAHGGSLYTLADIAAGSALIYQDQKFTTLNGSINYLSPGLLGSLITATAKVVREGGSTAVIDVDVTDDQENSLATAHFTYYKFKNK